MLLLHMIVGEYRIEKSLKMAILESCSYETFAFLKCGLHCKFTCMFFLNGLHLLVLY